MTDINEENKDLIENRIPFGLLEPDVQERLKVWETSYDEDGSKIQTFKRLR